MGSQWTLPVETRVQRLWRVLLGSLTAWLLFVTHRKNLCKRYGRTCTKENGLSGSASRILSRIGCWAVLTYNEAVSLVAAVRYRVWGEDGVTYFHKEQQD